MNLELDLLTNFNTTCSSVSHQNRNDFVTSSPRLVLHTDTTQTSQNRKEGRRNDPTNEDILPQPPRGVHEECKWKGCS
jgi:hypothetical protein